MTDTFQQWLAKHGNTPGLIACGIRQPGGQCVCHTVDDLCPPQKMEQLLSHFTVIKSSVIRDGELPCCNTWVFDQGHIHFVARPDNSLFALVLHADSEALLKVAELSAAFLMLAN